jgi:hypothetical protein
MRRHIIIGLVLALLLAAPVLAQVGGGYDLSWHTPSAGQVVGSLSSGYGLRSVAGQAEAGTTLGDTTSGYGLRSGFLQPMQATATLTPTATATADPSRTATATADPSRTATATATATLTATTGPDTQQKQTLYLPLVQH